MRHIKKYLLMILATVAYVTASIPTFASEYTTNTVVTEVTPQ